MTKMAHRELGQAGIGYCERANTPMPGGLPGAQGDTPPYLGRFLGIVLVVLLLEFQTEQPLSGFSFVSVVQEKQESKEQAIKSPI